MKRDSSTDSRKVLQNIAINFNEGLRNTTKKEYLKFCEFKTKSIKALSDFVDCIKDELQHSQSAAGKYLMENAAMKEPDDELILKFRIAIVKVLQKIAAKYLK